VLKFAPAVTSGSEGFSNGNSFMMVRGFQSVPQRNGLYSPLYVDGSIIQRVEVVKGPASLFYGQIAPGGVVNYITKRAQEKSFGTVSAQLGSYDLRARSGGCEPARSSPTAPSSGSTPPGRTWSATSTRCGATSWS
jgi:outer membrane receptor protein involved in Fe transport